MAWDTLIWQTPKNSVPLKISKSDIFLNTLHDFELAFLYKYNSQSLLQETEEKLKKQMREKGMNSSGADRLIKEYSNKIFHDHQTRCPRCRTEKIQTVEGKTMNCMVCGYSGERKRKSKFRQILEFIIDFFVSLG